MFVWRPASVWKRAPLRGKPAENGDSRGRKTMARECLMVGGGWSATTVYTRRVLQKECMAKRTKPGSEPRPGQPISLKTLGEYLNLSPATISLVLNNAPG